MKRCGLLLLAGMLTTAAVQADTHAIVGTWTLEVSTPRGIQHPTLVVKQNGEGYSGSYTGRRGELPIESVQVDGATFRFPLTVTMPMGEMNLDYSGRVTGNTMQGEIGNPRGSIPFTGIKAD